MPLLLRLLSSPTAPEDEVYVDTTTRVGVGGGPEGLTVSSSEGPSERAMGWGPRKAGYYALRAREQHASLNVKKEGLLNKVAKIFTLN